LRNYIVKEENREERRESRDKKRKRKERKKEQAGGTVIGRSGGVVVIQGGCLRPQLSKTYVQTLIREYF
jgi:hypothetical protein